ATQLTDSAGGYLFTNLNPGRYIVQFISPAGYLFTLVNVGVDDTIDSDAVAPGGFGPCTTLISGQTNRTVDAGLFRPSCIGDFVWEDLNGNGIQDSGEPGIPNVMLNLMNCSNGVVV